MCLVTTQEDYKIAKEDIIVYKLVKDGFNKNTVRALLYEFEYKLGARYRCYITKHNMKTLNDTSGLYFDNIARRKYDYRKCPLYVITTGFHAATNLDRLSDWVTLIDIKVVECIIPEGSEYYEDETGIIVSNQIIINKIIKFK